MNNITSMESKNLPHDARAERQLLGGMLRSAECRKLVFEHIPRPDWLHDPRHQAIFEITRNLHSIWQQPVNPATLAESLTAAGRLAEAGGESYIAGIAESVPALLPLMDTVHAVTSMHFRRLIIEAANNLVTRAQHGDDTPRQLAAYAREVFANMYARHTRRSIVSARDGTHDVVEALERLYHERSALLPTGFPLLDHHIGGIRRGELSFIAAPPDTGATSFAVHMLLHTLASSAGSTIPLLFFTPGNSVYAILQRMILTNSRINPREFGSGHADENAFVRIVDAAALLMETHLYLCDSCLTIDEIHEQAKRLATEHGRLGLIIIDHLQAVSLPFFDRPHDYTRIVRSCRDLARDLDTGVVLLARLQAQDTPALSRRPSLDDLKSFGDIARDIDLALFLHRKQYLNRDNDAINDLVELHIAKQSLGGRVFVETLALDRGCGCFINGSDTDTQQGRGL